MITAFRMALRSISGNKLRSALTMLGIVIGVMTLVVLVSLVNSATDSVTDAVSSLGTDLLTVNVLDDKGQSIDAATLEDWAQSEPAIGAIAPYATASVTAKHEAENGSMTVYGTTSAYYDIEGLKLLMGRFLKKTDVLSAARVFDPQALCVLHTLRAGMPAAFLDRGDSQGGKGLK